jgi:hypothetical protein
MVNEETTKSTIRSSVTLGVVLLAEFIAYSATNSPFLGGPLIMKKVVIFVFGLAILAIFFAGRMFRN